MVNEGVGGECQYDLCRMQFFEDPDYVGQRYLRKAGLVKEKDCPADPGLSSLNFLNNGVNPVFKPAITDSDAFVVNSIPPIIQNFPEVVSVGSLLVYKVAFAVEAQGFGTTSIQPIFCGFDFLQHDQRRTRHNFVAIPKCAAAGKTVDEIQLEYFASRTDVQPVKISSEIAAQDVEFGPAVFLDVGRRIVGMPLKLHFLLPW